MHEQNVNVFVLFLKKKRFKSADIYKCWVIYPLLLVMVDVTSLNWANLLGKYQKLILLGTCWDKAWTAHFSSCHYIFTYGTAVVTKGVEAALFCLNTSHLGGHVDWMPKSEEGSLAKSISLQKPDLYSNTLISCHLPPHDLVGID